MILEGDGVRLRPWRPADAPAVAAIAGDERVGRFSSIADGAEAWIAAQSRPGRISLAIAEPPGDEALGKVALRFSDGEIGFWLLPEARGRGLAVRAVRLLAAHAFERLALAHVILDIEEDNGPSLRVAAALGAVPFGEPHVEVDRGGVPRRLRSHRLPGP